MGEQSISNGHIGITHAIAVQGIEGTPVLVEADCGPGLPALSIVGLGDTAVSEARDRIRTAARNSGFPWPRTKVVVSLSPASLPKAGSAYDLALVCAILSCGGIRELVNNRRLQQTVLISELGLDGRTRPVRGVIPALMAASEHGYQAAVVPAEHAREAALVPNLKVYLASDLSSVVNWLCDNGELPIAENLAISGVPETDNVESLYGGSTSGTIPGASGIVPYSPNLPRDRELPDVPDMRDVVGNRVARRAMEVAAAGGHHILMVGPPGSGKSMLASRLPSLLPPLSAEGQLTVAAIQSVSGQGSGQWGSDLSAVLSRRRPYVEPHPSISNAGLIGGGNGMPQPGAISHAHLGVLFLDEAAEIRAGVLDSLRLPLEQGYVCLTRGRNYARYPAEFQLVLAMNPCRCAAATAQQCQCDSRTRARYRSTISAPLRDRLDIHIATQPQTTNTAITDHGESSAVIRQRVCAARKRAAHRWRRWNISGQELTNSDIPGPILRRWLAERPLVHTFLMTSFDHGQLSHRGIDRTIRVAFTIADLAGRDEPTLDDIAEAIELHELGGHSHVYA